MIYLGITSEFDKSSNKVKVRPLYSKEETHPWRKMAEENFVFLDHNKYKFQPRVNELIKYDLSPSTSPSVEAIGDRVVYIFDIPEIYPPLNFIRSVRKVELAEIIITGEILLKDSDSIYSSFRITSELAKFVKFEPSSDNVTRLRLLELSKDGDIQIFSFSHKGVNLNFIFKEDMEKIKNKFKEKGDILFIEDPKEILEKYQLLENFKLENKSGFTLLVNQYMLQVATKKSQAEVSAFEKKLSELEKEFNEKKDRNAIIKKETDISEERARARENEISAELEKLEVNLLSVRTDTEKEIERIERESFEKKENVLNQVRFLEENHLRFKKEVQSLSENISSLQGELNKLLKEKEFLLGLEEEIANREVTVNEEFKKLYSEQKILEIRENVIKSETAKFEQLKKDKVFLDKEVSSLKENKDTSSAQLDEIKRELDSLNKELMEKRWKLEKIKGEMKEVSSDSVQYIKGDNIMILMVEDNKLTRKVTSTILKKHNFDVVEIDNGSSALQMAIDKKPDLILMDLMLPDISGYEATERLKKSNETEAIPVVAFSALNDSGSIMKAMQAGCCDYLVKPFKINEFIQKICKFLPSEKLVNIEKELASG